MMLSDILLNIKTESVLGSLEHPVGSLIFDSREANSSSVFFAIKGSATDGHLFVQQAHDKGCRIFVVQNNIPDLSDSTIIKTSDTSALLASMSCNFFENPSKKLKLIGITGTNGKTTCTSLLYKLCSDLGYKCGLISTVVNKIGSTDIVATHTTPDPVSLNRLLAQMVTENCTHCFMEVSSHAIHQNRISGLNFSGAVFTNITHDHLDYHKTFSEYIRVKKTFFDLFQFSKTSSPILPFLLTDVSLLMVTLKLKSSKLALVIFSSVSMSFLIIFKGNFLFIFTL